MDEGRDTILKGQCLCSSVTHGRRDNINHIDVQVHLYDYAVILTVMYAEVAQSARNTVTLSFLHGD